MKIEDLQIATAVIGPPPEIIANRCGAYYSPYYYLMHLLAKEASLCVELGVEKGRGLVSFASGNSRARVVGFDTTRRIEIASVLDIFPNIEFREHPALPATDLGQPIDVLHIDTEHSYANAKAEFNAWKPYLADFAFVLFDDLNAMEGDVNRFFQELPYHKVRDDRLHPVCGYGVLFYES